MSFNLKKYAETPQSKMLQKHHDELGQDKRIGTTNKLLEKNRKDEDNPITEGQLKETHKPTKVMTTEGLLEADTESILRQTGNDKFDQLPINLLEEKRQQEKAKAYSKAQQVKDDVEFWDGFITQDIKDAPSQLHNHPSRFKNLTEDGIMKNEGVKKMVVASLQDADAMVYFIYRTAAEAKRNLTNKEKSLLDRISVEKVNILAKLNG